MVSAVSLPALLFLFLMILPPYTRVEDRKLHPNSLSDAYCTPDSDEAGEPPPKTPFKHDRLYTPQQGCGGTAVEHTGSRGNGPGHGSYRGSPCALISTPRLPGFLSTSVPVATPAANPSHPSSCSTSSQLAGSAYSLVLPRLREGFSLEGKQTLPVKYFFLMKFVLIQAPFKGGP
jgi:hypothetical protein